MNFFSSSNGPISSIIGYTSYVIKADAGEIYTSGSEYILRYSTTGDSSTFYTVSNDKKSIIKYLNGSYGVTAANKTYRRVPRKTAYLIENKEVSKGDYINTVTSTYSGTYPENNYLDSYWYVATDAK